MPKLTRRVVIRLSEDEYQELEELSKGFKSKSYYIRQQLKQKSLLHLRAKHMSKTEISRLEGIDRRKIYISVRGNIHKKLGRNDPCYCGSGKKFKKCCMRNENK